MSAPPATSAPRETARLPHFPALDGLRGFAILLVLVEHIAHRSGVVRGPLLKMGGLGVVLFFVLSGFLINHLLIAEVERRGGIDLRAFYRRRLYRIVPACYGYLAVLALLLAVHYMPEVRWKDLATSALFVRNLFGFSEATAHLWSVSIEQQFYLGWPVLFLVFRPKTVLKIGWGIFLGVIAWRTYAILSGHYESWSPVIYLRTDFRFDAIMAGCLTAFAYHTKINSTTDPAAPPCACRLREIKACLLAVAIVAWTGWAPYSRLIFSQFITVQVIICALLLRELVWNPASSVGKLCSTRPLRLLGRYSYSLYLWQQLLLVVSLPGLNGANAFAPSLLLLTALTLASYHLIEQPFLNRKSKFTKI